MTRAKIASPAPMTPPAEVEPPTAPEPTIRRSLRRPERRPEVTNDLAPTPPSPSPSPPTATDRPASRPPPASVASAFRTRDLRGIDISKLNIAKQDYSIEILDKARGWVPLFPMTGTSKQWFGREVGSSLASVRSLALRHILFENTSRGLFVRPGRTLNGVFRRLTGPIVLADGLRIRISDYFLTFRESQPPEAAEPATSEGECLLARDLWALGYLEFLRPDDQPGVRFPIFNPVATILGRGGLDDEGREIRVDLPLIEDPNMEVSRRHARIAGRGKDDLRLTLTDLNSRTGTWAQVRDRTQVHDGDEFWLGEIVIRVVASD